MTQIEKKSLTVSTNLLPRTPDKDIKKEPDFHEDEPMRTCFDSLKKSHLRMREVTLRHPIKTVTVNPKNHPLTPLVLGVLFPGTLISALLKIHNLPENTLEEKIEKENTYRNLILCTYDLKETIIDKNNALRAIISSITPDIDPNSQEITSNILRGDIIEHVIKHPKRFSFHFQSSGIAFNEWCSCIANTEGSIGTFELRVMSDMLETPIHVYSYDHPQLEASGKTETGKQFNKAALNLYYDPIRNTFHPMQGR